MNTDTELVSTPVDSAAGATPSPTADWHAAVEAACEQACRAIAPSWPLDRSVAVNPHWKRIHMPVRRVAARMMVLGHIQVLAPRAMLRQVWQEGRIQSRDLACALAQQSAEVCAGWTPDTLIAALDTNLRTPQLPLLIDVLDNDPRRGARLSWRQAITYQVSQTCAAWFDTQQAEWQPQRQTSLYAFWRDTLGHDYGIGTLMGLPGLGDALKALPPTRQEAERWVLERVQLPPEVWADYLEAVLLTVNGWASWCAYLGWQAELRGQRDEHLRDLLAIRLAWGAILLEGKNDTAAHQAFHALQHAWHEAPALLAQSERELLVDELWQWAYEAGYQRELSTRLAAACPPVAEPEVQVQAAFCIDVRSEPLRRAIEAVWPAVQTLGFAGFFGVPLAYTPFGSHARRPQLPGLLGPALEVGDEIIPARGDTPATELNAAALQAREQNLGVGEQWQSAGRWPGAAFSYVEAAGVTYLKPLWRFLNPSGQARANEDHAGLPMRLRPLCRPGLQHLAPQAKVELAAKVLRATGLARQLAPLVLFVGHGSQTANNATASALDCGACSGQTGEANARSLARLLNEPEVRIGLAEQGIAVPTQTWFIGALHNTATDEIEAFDLDLMPAPARPRWEQLQAVLRHACDQARRERAPTLGLTPRGTHTQVLRQFRRRANDGAQNRPEWGLAGNASFIIGPRWRSRGIVLGSRCFLHAYDSAQDPQGTLLEQLMTAPMLVTHWINWQYNASTCDPERLGTGNKLLLNVVGGHIGVFEGNGGDLRIGLPLQSLHDGTRWVHEPLRLTTVIDAPATAIEGVLQRQAVVRQLVDNGWMHLWRWAHDGRLVRYARGQWHALPWSQAV
ncbi:MAG: DUF2309 domain-containing protein [Comamonas sp.]|nr:DUF2309 domain-containing protein [Comamonas sp.]